MAAFSRPAAFVTVRADLPDTSLPLSISDMTAVLKEHLHAFLQNPEAFSGLPYEQSQTLFGRMEVFLEVQKLASSGKTSWALVTPIGIQSTPVSDFADLGLRVVNPQAPGFRRHNTYTTALGRMMENASTIVERHIAIVLSAGSVPASFRLADAVYMWLIAMRPVLKQELGCHGVSLDPVRPVAEKERFMFEPIAGTPLLIVIKVTSIPGFVYGDPDPA
jgi:hypothetical protein